MLLLRHQATAVVRGDGRASFQVVARKTTHRVTEGQTKHRSRHHYQGEVKQCEVQETLDHQVTSYHDSLSQSQQTSDVSFRREAKIESDSSQAATGRSTPAKPNAAAKPNAVNESDLAEEFAEHTNACCATKATGPRAIGLRATGPRAPVAYLQKGNRRVPKEMDPTERCGAAFRRAVRRRETRRANASDSVDGEN